MSDREPLDLTFVVIAYNEEGLLEATIREIREFLETHKRRAPILIMDDGSRDRTPEIADRLAAQYEEVEVFHHPRNVGQYFNIRKGIELSRTTYYVIIPADNQFVMSSFGLFLPFVGQYDVIFGFPNNEWVRGRRRVLLSHFWRLYLLFLFGISVTYLAGMIVAPVELVRRIRCHTTGFMGLYELSVRLVLSGATFIQVPFLMRDREAGVSKAFNPLRNLRDVFRMLPVWWRIKGPGTFSEGREYPEIRRLYEEYKAEQAAKPS